MSDRTPAPVPADGGLAARAGRAGETGGPAETSPNEVGSPVAPRSEEPMIIQGGMGVGVSGWPLASAVSRAGQLGVVSGTAIEVVHARRLADGDLGGHLRRAYASFPVPGVAERVIERYFRPSGRSAGESYDKVEKFTLRPSRGLQELTVLSSYAEVWLAREGHGGPVGVNLLQKIQLPTVHTLYGAMLAGVAAVLMGAGVPSAIPALLRGLASGERVGYSIDVERPAEVQDPVAAELVFDPTELFSGAEVPGVPSFYAIVASHTLATFLGRDPVTRPDGFVVEGPTAGGHNAPPRRSKERDERGQPVYGPRDVVDLEVVAAQGLPFWMAGGYGTPQGLVTALSEGAQGIQVGSAFACCEESGMAPELRDQIRQHAAEGTLSVLTDVRASPTGFPFKLVELEGSLSEGSVRARRERVCNLGYLRVAFTDTEGNIGYRCAAEPVANYLRKGGDPADTEGRVCLCNGLLATADYPQLWHGEPEPPVVTGGDAMADVVRALSPDGVPYHAADVIEHLLSGLDGPRLPASDSAVGLAATEPARSVDRAASANADTARVTTQDPSARRDGEVLVAGSSSDAGPTL